MVCVPFQGLDDKADTQSPVAVLVVLLEGWDVLVIVFVAAIFQGTQYHSENKC